MISSQRADQVVAALSHSSATGSALRQEAMQYLSELKGYEWSGIYTLHGDTLKLAEFVGAPTDHTSIKVGVGVCGSAVAQNVNMVIEDVNALDNYLSCSIQTKSEIVVLIKDKHGNTLGQIDIDGHEIGGFDATDEAFLERVADILAARWQ